MKSKNFEFAPFSTKQRRLIYWWADGSPHREKKIVIAEGAIRSGKTIAMICGFLIWSCTEFDGEVFILAGKTIGALKKNVIGPMLKILGAWGLGYHYVSTGDEARIEIGKNVYYLYDAHNERSQDRLQGLTAAGALADEVALFPESFIEQMIGRCSVTGSRIWMNCNPGAPSNYVKTELIDKQTDKEILVLKFCMEDNLSLSAEIKAMYYRMYTGVFYRRFIRGEWAMTAGLIYQEFANNPGQFTVTELPQISRAVIGVDFGGTGSAHSFTLLGFTNGMREVVVLAEYYHDNKRSGTLSPTELDAAFVAFCKEAKRRYRVYEAFCDSAEQTLIQGLRIAMARSGLGIEVKNAVKGPINDRIAFFNSMMAQGRFLCHSSCVHTIQALRDAVYDPKSETKDIRLDDGTTNIDSLDSMEYAVERNMSDILYLGIRR